MRSFKTWLLLSYLFAGATMAFAEDWKAWELVCGSREGVGGGVDVSFREPKGRGGDIYGRFRNRTREEYSVEIRVRAIDWDGKPIESKLSAVLKPGATLADGGNWVPARKVLGFEVLECGPSKTSAGGNISHGSGRNSEPGENEIAFPGYQWTMPPYPGGEAMVSGFGKVIIKIKVAGGLDELWMRADAFNVKGTFQIRLLPKAGDAEKIETVTLRLGRDPVRAIAGYRVLAVKAVTVDKQ